MTAFNDRHLAQVTPLCLALALIFVGAAQPARAEPLNTRLDATGSIAPERSRPRIEWLQQWGSPRPRKTGDIVITQGSQRGPLSLIIIGTGVLAGGAGTYFGVKNLSATSDWRAATTPAAITDARNRARSAATMATIAWAAAGVLASLGVGLLLFTEI